MAGCAEHVDPHFFNGDGQHPRRLGCVDDKNQSVLFAESGELADGKHGSRHIGSVGAGNGPGFRTNEVCERLERPVVVAFINVGHRIGDFSGLGHGIDGPEH